MERDIEKRAEQALVVATLSTTALTVYFLFLLAG
jgi:hypothetical protein